MALSFFHGGQLAKGVQVYEEEGEGSQRVQSLRRLYSETALRERLQSDNGSRSSHTPSRPRTASRPRTGIRSETPRARFQEQVSRPGEGRLTEIRPQDSPSPKVTAETSKPQSRAFWGITKPSFLSLRGGTTEKVPDPERPKSSGPDRRSWKQKEAARKQVTREPAPAVQPPTAERSTRAATPQAPFRDSQPSRLGESRRVDTPVAAQGAANPAQFLAESLAHVIVGEWLYKDPHKPGLFPQSNILQRHMGPPPRGATGVPQRRWFRIDPYERMLSWSSKWDTVETAEHKMSRKVPIKLVFEVPNRLPLDGCIPAHAAPFDYSIVIVAPSKVLKITAPDESRHNMWLTALQYMVDATKKVDDKGWPDVLAARLALLTSPIDDMFNTSKPLPTPTEETKGTLSTNKPLPPSPPRSATVSTAMRPPSVPRFPQHTRDTSAGLSTTAESEAMAPSEPGSKMAASSIRSQRVEPYTPSDDKHVSEPRQSTQEDTRRGKEREDDDTDTDVGQMDALLDRLPGM